MNFAIVAINANLFYRLLSNSFKYFIDFCFTELATILILLFVHEESLELSFFLCINKLDLIEY